MFTSLKKTSTIASAIAIAAMIGVSSVPAYADHRGGQNQWRQDRQTNYWNGRDDRYRDRWAERRAERQAERRAERRAERQAEREAERRAERRAKRNRNRNNNAEAALVGGLIGLGAAIIIGSSMSQPRHSRPVATAPNPYSGPRPWSSEWHSYCGSKYRSFNPRTGYFLSHSGDYQFCR